MNLDENIQIASASETLAVDVIDGNLKVVHKVTG
jgi:hypothetical protein